MFREFPLADKKMLFVAAIRRYSPEKQIIIILSLANEILQSLTVGFTHGTYGKHQSGSRG
jgi:hypothetical protein